MSTLRWPTRWPRRGLLSVAVVALLAIGGLLASDPSSDRSSDRSSDPVSDPVAAGSGPLGFLAGDADQVTAHRSWWRLDWPPGRRDETAASLQALSVPGSETRDGSTRQLETNLPADDPGSTSPGAQGDAMAAGAGDRTGAEGNDPGPPATARRAMRSEEGFDVAAGVVESGDGELVSYTIELEPAVAEDLLALTAAVEEALHDPRSWVRDHRLRRVEDPAEADVRVVLATPDTVDRLCGEVGLRTEGLYSCWNGTFAALNAMRWERGADDFEDLTTYRRYLVNHEFGHGLGHGHVDCPAPGAPAPVMMQQTISTGPCHANGWPYPDASSD